MKIPYGYSLVNGEIVLGDKKAEVIYSFFAHYLAGSSLGKVVDMLFAKGIPSPTGKPRWTRAAVDKILAHEKYIPMSGQITYHGCSV